MHTSNLINIIRDISVQLGQKNDEIEIRKLKKADFARFSKKIMKMASKDHLSDDDDDDKGHLPTIHSIRIPFLPPLSHL